MSDRNRFNSVSRYQQDVSFITRRDEEDANGRKKASGDDAVGFFSLIAIVGFVTFLWFKYLA